MSKRRHIESCVIERALKNHAIRDDIRVSQDQVWWIEKDMQCVGNPIGKKTRKVTLKAGQPIEIRFSYAWHFRTLNNKYYQVGEDVLRNHCVPVGKIWNDVHFSNGFDLQQIWDMSMFKPFDIHNHSNLTKH